MKKKRIKKTKSKMKPRVHNSKASTAKLLKKFLPDENINPQNTVVKTNMSLMNAQLKDIPPNSRFVINEDSLVTVEDDDHIKYRLIFDLLKFGVTGNSLYIFAIDFMGWLVSLEQEAKHISSAPDDVTVKFISKDEVLLSVVLECKTIKEGLEMVGEMQDKNYVCSNTTFDQCDEKYGIEKIFGKFG